MFRKKIKTFKQISGEISVADNESNLIFFVKLFNDIEYFIFFGTLLGITREKKLIDGDDDIDFYVNLNDRDQLIHKLKQENVEVDLTLSVNKNKHFLQVKRNINNKILIADFYFYETDIEKNHIIERWNFEGGTHIESKYLRIPKVFIYPLKKVKFNSEDVVLPKENELLCEFLYGRNWMKKLKKDSEYTIKVINGKPCLYLIKKFLFYKKLILVI
jgi:hypothetical protein